MPYVEVDGNRKKVACGPCIRGHRSSKCEHHDRVMIEVRKPGRPLSSCPHPPGTCTCTRVVINYTIPKNAACPSTAAAASAAPSTSSPQTPKASSATGANRVSKPRQKRTSTSINIAAVEKALKTDDNDTGVDASNESSAKNQSSSDVCPSSNQTSAAEYDQAVRGVPQRSLSYSDSKPPNFDQNPLRETPSGSQTISQPIAGDNETIKIEGSCCSAKSKQEPHQSAKPSCCSGKGDGAEAGDQPQAEQQQQSQGQFKHPAAFAAQLDAIYSGANLADAFMYDRPMPASNNVAMSTSGFFNFDSSTHTQPDLAYQYGLHPDFPSVHMSSVNRQPSLAMDHDCNCGDDCACLGCAAHPHNKTTTNYILKMNEYMMAPSSTHEQLNLTPSAPDADARYAPRTPNAPPFAYNAPDGMAPGSAYSNTQLSTNATAQPAPAGFGYPQQQSGHEQWHMNPAQSSAQITPTQDMEKLYMYIGPSRPPLANGNDLASPERHAFNQIPPTNGMEERDYDNSTEQSPEGQSPVLSPSAFYLQSLVIPGCTDISGTCHCGDGCECIGCLTHGGHNGIPLEPVSEANRQDDQSGAQYLQVDSANFHGATYGDAQTPNVNTGAQSFPPPQPNSIYASPSFMNQAPVSHASNPVQFAIPAFAGSPS